MRLPQSKVARLKRWHELWKEFAHDPDNRSAIRAGHRNHAWRASTRVQVQRGSIDQRARDGTGHWYSFFPGENGVVLFDPSYPSGPYYFPARVQRLLSTARLMFGQPVSFFESAYPAQLHDMDTFCQTWSMIALAPGTDEDGVSWQTRLTSVLANNSNEDRLQLLFDFIVYWMEQVHGIVHARQTFLYQELQDLRPWFDHFYNPNDVVRGRHLWPRRR